MTPSTISITLAGVDITSKVLFRETQFTIQANPIQGTFKVAVKDLDHTFSPTAGEKIKCFVDGVPLFGGYVMQISRGFFFPAEDTENPTTVARKWTLTGPDFNILWDKRVLYDSTDPTSELSVPSGSRTISKAFKYMMDNFVDVPVGLDYDTHVDVIKTAFGSAAKGSLLVGQGKTVRDQMEDFMDHGAVMYYIDADFAVHLHEYEVLRLPWMFTDYLPDGTNTVGFREGEYIEDFSQIVTQSLVWGGSSIRAADGGPEGEVVFAKYPQAPANSVTIWEGTESEAVLKAWKEQQALDRRAQYGRWEMAEERAGQSNYLVQDSVTSRAYAIINGPIGVPPTYGLESGFNKALDTMRCTWFAHDVPADEHVRPGYLMDFTLYTQDKIFTLPCRSIQITFPTLPADSPGDTWVRFDGEFGISFSDRRYLWKALRRQQRELRGSTTVVVDNSSTDVPPGSWHTVWPNETTNGTRKVFTFPFTFYRGEFNLFMNGLVQRENLDYTYDPNTKQVTFVEAPGTGDQIWAGGYGSQ